MDIQVILQDPSQLLPLIMLYTISIVQSEMKFFGWYDTEALKKHYGKKIRELEEEKRIVQVIINSIEYLFPLSVSYLRNNA